MVQEKVLINSFDSDEYEKLMVIFKCHGVEQVFDELIGLILPPTKTLLSIITGFG